MAFDNNSENGIAPEPSNTSGDSSDLASATTDTATEADTGNTNTPTAEPSARPQSMIEAAFERAEKARATGKPASGDSALSTEQAAVTDSASTPATDTNDTPATGEHDGTSGQNTGDSTPPADASDQQSLTPPDSWPKERRKKFDTLPDTGKSLLMSIYRDMESGLKQSFNKLADERKTLQDQYGFDTEQLKQLTDRARTFQNDPVAVISQLADEAGIDVFFKESADTIPSFDSQEDLVKWLRNQSQQEARQAAANEAKSLRQQQQQAAMKQQLDTEFAEAYRNHPDLADHQDAIIKYISGFNLPVEMAYKLATYEGLTKLAHNGQATLAELNKTKAELEKLQKLATMPPGRADGRSRKEQANGLDPYEAAMQRAEQLLGR